MSNTSLQKAYNDLSILREKNLQLIERLDEKDMHVIPEGFSNNIYWHAGHLLTVQESLLYRRSQLDMHIPQPFLQYFAKGSSPADFDDAIPETGELLKNLRGSLSQIEKDISIYSTASYSEPVTVSFGMRLNSFSDALIALPYHEAYHFGSMKILQKFLK